MPDLPEFGVWLGLASGLKCQIDPLNGCLCILPGRESYVVWLSPTLINVNKSGYIEYQRCGRCDERSTSIVLDIL